MSSTANDHATAGSDGIMGSNGKNKVPYAKQQGSPVGASRLRLDALTIAGLTGTPHDGGTAAARRFFGTAAAAGASASPRSPARSDDTLASIQDSSVGDEDKDDGDGSSSVLSDELGEIAFTDDEHDSSGSDNDELDDGGGAAGGSRDVLRSEKVQEEEARRSGTAVDAGQLVTEWRTEDGEAAAAAAAPPDSTIAAPRSTATTKAATASGVERSGDSVMSSAASGVDGGAAAHSADASSPLPPARPAAQAAQPPGNEGEQPQRCTPRSFERSADTEEQPRQPRPQQQHADNRDATELVGSSAAAAAAAGTTSTVSTSTSAADAASCSTVSGADSGGGGVSASLQAVPAGTVPTVTCKVLVVGNAKCGKSSIISRFVSNRFSSDYTSTVGADYAMKDVCLQGGRQMRLQLWDIAGQDRFAKLTRAYFRRAKGAVVVCDVTREGTFDAIVRWKEEIDLWCQNEGCELPVYLFANKCDLLTEVQDSFLAGAKMEKTCRDSGFAGWYITSAKRGDNINTAMTNLLEHALKAEDQRNRSNSGVERGRSVNDGTGGGANGDDGGGRKGDAFQLSSGGRRHGQGLGGQQGACCA